MVAIETDHFFIERMATEHHAVLGTDLLWCPDVLWYSAVVAWKPYNIFTPDLAVVIPFLGNLLQNSVIFRVFEKEAT